MKKIILLIVLFFGLIIFSNDKKMNYETVTKNVKDKNWEILAKYPKFYGKNIKNLNKEIKNVIGSFYNSWYEFFTKEYIGEPEINSIAELDYTIVHADTNLVSILFYTMGYTGGAHPNHQLFSFNYNISDEKILTVEDLIIKEILPKIADYCEEEIKKQLKENGYSGFAISNYLGEFTVEI